MAWYKKPYFKLSLKNLMFNFQVLTLKYHFISAISGFFIILVIISQLLSGIMLSFSLLPECMLIPIIRDEEDLEDLYIDDFFWLHERGVDLVFIFIYFHLLRKMYINVFYLEQEFSWKSGVFSYFVFFVTTFFGLVLCCTHLSEVTLTIGANIVNTFFFMGKIYWWLFTNMTLNTDVLVRLAYLHYIAAFYLFFLSLIHALDMHYDWKNDINFDGLDFELIWYDEGLSSEVSAFFDIFGFWFFFGIYIYSDPESLSYEIFMWGDVGFITDVRFLSVAPHWYFRPFQAWLIVCPFHKIGVAGIIYYFFILFHQVSVISNNEFLNYFKFKKQVDLSNNYNYIFYTRSLHMDVSLSSQLYFYSFVMALLYITSFLPYGRFYNPIGGNMGMLISYLYAIIYLSFFNTRNSVINNYFYTKFLSILKYTKL